MCREPATETQPFIPPPPYHPLLLPSAFPPSQSGFSIPSIVSRNFCYPFISSFPHSTPPAPQTSFCCHSGISFQTHARNGSVRFPLSSQTSRRTKISSTICSSIHSSFCACITFTSDRRAFSLHPPLLEAVI